MILAEVERVLGAHGFARRGDDVVLVACSGGLDSIVLAHAVVELFGARRVVVGHVDHAVRAGSAEDAAFVEAFARALGAGFATTRLPPGPASEDRLRTLRYEALASMAEAHGARFVLTAHTEDDQAETVLLALVRSTHVEGLRGMPVRRGNVLRPMLHVPRRVIRARADTEGLAWRDDPSNREPWYLRNRVRKELLPLLESRYRPGISRRLAALAAELEALVPRAPDVGSPAADAGSPARRTMPRSAGTSGRRGEFPQTLPVAPAEPAQVPEAPSVCFTQRPWAGGPVPDGRSTAVFDAELLESPVIRGARPGDRVEPFGFDGHKKLSELLRAAGVPTGARPGYPVVADQDGAIVWVPGIVRSVAAPVSSLTRNVWVFWMDGRSSLLQDGPRSVTLNRPEPRSSIEGQDHRPAKEPGQDDE
ncbi:tRNA lysidine(34) synthetase TilS [Myxococcota bacterium]|nr:tRNA lysidine(34) synthetase TilS [Myxococcota bacterium]